MELLWDCCVIAVGLLWDSCGLAVGTVVVLQDCCEIAIRLLWDYYGIAVVLLGYCPRDCCGIAVRFCDPEHEKMKSPFLEEYGSWEAPDGADRSVSSSCVFCFFPHKNRQWAKRLTVPKNVKTLKIWMVPQ